MSDIAILGDLITTAVRAFSDNSPRTAQSNAGLIGMSDLGFCRQKALLMMRGIAQSDPNNTAAAQIGTAIHDYYRRAIEQMFPEWIVDSQRVVAKFPGGYEVPGTPDIIATDYNAIVDIKSMDGFTFIKRLGPSQSNRYQRHGYALAAIQMGLLDPSKPVWVANYYVDRSARESEPYFVWEEFDPTLTDEINDWIDDVVYANKTGEDASRDVASSVCVRFCPFFTVCRGGLEVFDGNELITDETQVDAARVVYEGRQGIKELEQQVDAGRDVLVGVNGITDEYQVRWVSVGAKGTMRLDVIPLDTDTRVPADD